VETTSQIEKHRGDLYSVVESVFTTMLGMELHPVDRPPPRAATTITAAVQFVGAWRGAVLLKCSREQMERFATRLTGLGPGQIDEEDARDAIGEVVNMIGGNMKSILTPGVALSVPTVVEGTDYLVRLCGKGVATAADFVCEDGPFSVAVVEFPKEATVETGEAAPSA